MWVPSLLRATRVGGGVVRLGISDAAVDEDPLYGPRFVSSTSNPADEAAAA
jgi:hypothetical protein